MTTSPEPPPRRDPITTATTALAALLAIASAPLLFARGWVLETLALPLVEGRFSDDGVVGEQAVAFVERLLGGAAWGLLAAAVAVVVWGRLGTSAARAACGPDDDAAPRADAWWIPAAASVLLVAVAWRFLERGFGYDEIFTTQQFVTTASFWDTASSYKLFNNHIAYSLLARVAWLVSGGTGETALRIPALLLGAATLCATWRLGFALVGRRAAIVGVGLLAVSPSLVEWSTSARGYSGLMATTAWALAAYLELLAGRRVAWQLAAALALGAWFHLYAVLVGLALGAHLVCTARTVPETVSPRAVRSCWWALGGAAAGTLLLHAPVLPRLVVEVLRRRPGTFDPTFPFDVLAELTGAAPGALYAALVAFAAVGFVRIDTTRALAVLAVAGAPLMLLWAVIQPYDLYGRFFAFAVPPFVLLVARGVLSVTPRVPWLAGVVVATVASLWVLGADAVVDEEGYRAAARHALGLAGEPALPPPGDDVLLLALGGGGELFSFYVGRDLPIPSDLASFEALVEDGRALRVLHRPTPWQPEHHGQIASWLATHGATLEHGNARLYVWTP